MWLLLNILVFKCLAPQGGRDKNERGEMDPPFKSPRSHLAERVGLATVVVRVATVAPHLFVYTFAIRSRNQQSEHRSLILEDRVFIAYIGSGKLPASCSLNMYMAACHWFREWAMGSCY